MLRKELRERFQAELTPAEKAFFLKTAREGIFEKGHLRLLLVEGTRDIEGAVKLYREKLESGRLSAPDREGGRFLESFRE